MQKVNVQNFDYIRICDLEQSDNDSLSSAALTAFILSYLLRTFPMSDKVLCDYV